MDKWPLPNVRRYVVYICIGCVLYFSEVNASPDWDKWDDSVIRLLVVGKSGLDFSVESGTAFAINDNGDYITNHHVIETALKGGEIVAVESLEPEKIHKVDIVWESQEHDLAMVNIVTWKNKPVTLSNGSNVKKGQDVYSIGFPGAADRDNPAEFNVSTVKKGILSAFKSFPLMAGGRNIKMLEHDAPVNSGNSGGPLADACGRVIGINEQKALSGLVKQGDNVAVNTAEGILFSINTIELMALLDQNKVSYQRDDKLCAGSASHISNTTLLAIAGLALLTLLAFVFLFRRVQQASPDGRVNTRVISRMIRDRMSGSSSSRQQSQPQQARTYYSHNDGRIIHRDEQEANNNQRQSPPSASQVNEQILYRLIPQRSDLGLPSLSLPSPGNYRLGRDQSVNIQLVVPNQYVSSEHAVIIVNPDHSVAVEALASTNGTQVAGVLMSPGEILALQEGEVLRLGHDEVIYTLQRG